MTPAIGDKVTVAPHAGTVGVVIDIRESEPPEFAVRFAGVDGLEWYREGDLGVVVPVVMDIEQEPGSVPEFEINADN